MYIRLNFGPKAGEIDFVRTDIARQLIESGRATDPRLEEIEPSKVIAQVQKPPTAVVKRERRV